MSSEPSRRISGKFPYKMDPKNRVAIPPGWRPKLDDILYLLVVEDNGEPVIKVLTEERLAEIERQVETDSTMSTGDKNDFIDWLNGESEEVSINTQGKLLIPKKKCDEARLKVDIVLVGRKNYFEIWDSSTYATAKGITKPNIETIRKTYRFV